MVIVFSSATTVKVMVILVVGVAYKNVIKCDLGLENGPVVVTSISALSYWLATSV